MTEKQPSVIDNETGEVLLEVQRNPLDPKPLHSQAPAGATVREILGSDYPGRVFVNGQLVGRHSRHLIRPKAGALVTVESVPEGGGGGKNPLRTILTIAVVAAAIIVPAALVSAGVIAAGGLAAGGISAGIGILGNLAINALIPPSQPSLPSVGSNSFKNLDSITRFSNQIDRYGAVTQLLGERSFFPKVVGAPYTVFEGDKQYGHVLLLLGYGPLTVIDKTIQGTSFENFNSDGQVVQWDIGETPAYYTNDSNTEDVQASFEEDNDEYTRTTQKDTDEIVVSIVADRLFSIDRHNNTDGATVGYLIQYREKGNGWKNAVLAAEVEYSSSNFYDKVGEPDAWRTVQTTTGGFKNGTRVRVPATYQLPVYNTPRDLLCYLHNDESKPARASIRWRVPTGQYDVRVRRFNHSWDQPDRVQEFNDSTWHSLRSISHQAPVNIPGAILMSVRILADKTLNGVIDQIKVRAKSHLRTFDGEEWTEPKPTANPAWCYAHSLAGYSASRPVEYKDINGPAMLSWARECSERGWTTSTLVDVAISAFDLGKEIASNAFASRTIDRAGYYSVVRDFASSFTRQTFTPRNTWDFQASRTVSQEVHGFRVQFKNKAKDWADDEVVAYHPDFDETTASRFETLQLPNVETEELAKLLGLYHLAVAIHRPENYSFKTNITALRCARGDLVRVQHDVPLWGNGSGWVISTVANEDDEQIRVILDDSAALTGDEDLVGRVTHRRNGKVSLVSFHNPGPGRHNKFELKVPGEVEFGIDDLVAVGRRNHETSLLKISRIKFVDSNHTAQLFLVDAAPQIDDIFEEEIGERDPNITEPPDFTRVAAPQPTILNPTSDETVALTNDDGSLTFRLQVPVAANDGRTETARIIVGIRARGDVQGSWRTATAESGVAYFEKVRPGEILDIRALAVGVNGVESKYAYRYGYQIAGRRPQPPTGFNARVGTYSIEFSLTGGTPSASYQVFMSDQPLDPDEIAQRGLDLGQRDSYSVGSLVPRTDYYFYAQKVNLYGASKFLESKFTTRLEYDAVMQTLAGDEVLQKVAGTILEPIPILTGDETVPGSVANQVGKEAAARAKAVQDAVDRADEKLAKETQDRIDAIKQAAGNAADSLSAEADKRAEQLREERRQTLRDVENEAQARADAVLNERNSRKAEISNETEKLQSVDESLASAVSTLAAGTGEQFDTFKIWYYDNDLAGWTGGSLRDGFIVPNAGENPTLVSPNGLDVDAPDQRYVKARIKKQGSPGWVGRLYWRKAGGDWEGPATLDEPSFQDDGDATITWKDLPWTGTVDQIKVELADQQSETDEISADWLAIGRPTPGASTAAVQRESAARIDGLNAEALERETFAAQMRGEYEGTDPAELTQGLIYRERQVRQDAESVIVRSVESAQATADGNTVAITDETAGRVSENEAQASRMDGIEADLATTDGKADANAQGYEALDSRVSETEQGIEALSQSSTELESSLTQANDNLDALSGELGRVEDQTTTNAGALETLETRIESTEEGVESESRRTDALSAALSESVFKADASRFQENLVGNVLRPGGTWENDFRSTYELGEGACLSAYVTEARCRILLYGSGGTYGWYLDSLNSTASFTADDGSIEIEGDQTGLYSVLYDGQNIHYLKNNEILGTRADVGPGLKFKAYIAHERGARIILSFGTDQGVGNKKSAEITADAVEDLTSRVAETEESFESQSESLTQLDGSLTGLRSRLDRIYGRVHMASDQVFDPVEGGGVEPRGVSTVHAFYGDNAQGEADPSVSATFWVNGEPYTPAQNNVNTGGYSNGEQCVFVLDYGAVGRGENPFPNRSSEIGPELAACKFENGTWYYDDNSGWAEFEPTETMAVVAYGVLKGHDDLAAWPVGVPLDEIKFPFDDIEADARTYQDRAAQSIVDNAQARVRAEQGLSTRIKDNTEELEIQAEDVTRLSSSLDDAKPNLWSEDTSDEIEITDDQYGRFSIFLDDVGISAPAVISFGVEARVTGGQTVTLYYYLDRRHNGGTSGSTSEWGRIERPPLEVPAGTQTVDFLVRATGSNGRAFIRRVMVNEGAEVLPYRQPRATAGAVDLLRTQVSDAQGRLESQSDDLTTLTNELTLTQDDLDTTKGDVEAAQNTADTAVTAASGNSAALNGLTSRVAQTEGGIESLSNDTTALSNDLSITREIADRSKAYVEGGALVVPYPKGGTVRIGNGRRSDFAVILPTLWNSDSRIQFTVAVYSDRYTQSYQVLVSGVLYEAGERWASPSARLVGSKRDGIKVHFGDNGTNAVVFLETASGSNHNLQVVVKDFSAGIGDISKETWVNGWAVTTARKSDFNIGETIDNPLTDAADTVNVNGRPAEDVTQQLDASADAVRTLDNRVSETEDGLESASNARTRLSNDISSVKTTADTAREEASGNSGAVSGLDSRVAETESGLASAAANFSSLESGLSQTNETVSGVEGELAALTEQVDTKASIDRVDNVESDAESARGTMRSAIEAGYSTAISESAAADQAAREALKSGLQTEIDSKASLTQVAQIESDAESARGSLKNDLEVSFAADLSDSEAQAEASRNNLQGQIDNRATIAQVEEVESGAESALAQMADSLQTSFSEEITTSEEKALDAAERARKAADSSSLNFIGGSGARPKQFRLFGNQEGVPDTSVNGEILWQGDVYEISRDIFEGTATGEIGTDSPAKGFLAFDLNQGDLFSIRGEPVNVAFVRSNGGDWEYNEGDAWISFVDARVVVIGWAETNGSEITAHGLFGKPVSLRLASFPSADVTGENKANDTANVGDRSAGDVNADLDTVQREVNTKASLDRLNEVESDAESARGTLKETLTAEYSSAIKDSEEAAQAARDELDYDIRTRATSQELRESEANAESARSQLQTTVQSSFNDQFAAVQQDLRTKADADTVESLYTVRVQGQTSEGTPIWAGLSIGTNGESTAIALSSDTFSVVQPDGSEIPAFVVDTVNNRTVQNEAVIGTVNFTKLIDSTNSFIVNDEGKLKADYIDVDNISVNYSLVVGGPPEDADRTADNTARSIRNQGAFATKSEADWKSDITGDGKPEDGAQANAANSLNIIANENFSGNTSNGEILLFGSRNGKPDKGVDGFVSFKGIKQVIPRGDNFTITTGASRSKGFLVADLSNKDRFAIKNSRSRCAFVRKSTNNWQYDNGSSWVNFDINTGTVAAIGWMEAGGDYVYAYGLFGAPIDLEVSSMPGADVTAESTAKDTANVGDRPSSQVLDDVDTSKSLANESISQIIKGAENKVRKPTFEDGDVGGWGGGTDVSSNSDSLITTRRSTTEEHRFSVMPGQRLFCAMSVFTKESNYTVKIGIRTNTGKYIEGAGLSAGKSFADVNGSLIVPDDATSAQAYILIDGYDNDLGRAYVKNLYIGSSQLGSDRTGDNEAKSARSAASQEKDDTGRNLWEFHENGDFGFRYTDPGVGKFAVVPTGIYAYDAGGNLRYHLRPNGSFTQKSATSGERLEQEQDRIRVFDSNGQVRVTLGRL